MKHFKITIKNNFTVFFLITEEKNTLMKKNWVQVKMIRPNSKMMYILYWVSLLGHFEDIWSLLSYFEDLGFLLGYFEDVWSL